LNNEEQSLTRVLGQWDVIALAFGAMIGFSWIVLAGSWVQDAGTMGAVVAILIGGVMVAFVGLTYSELVSAMPKAGGEHNYVWRAMGARAAFVASWALALGYVAVVGFEAVALPTALNYVIPQLETGFLWTVAGYDVYLVWALVGSVAAVAITYLNYIGIRPASVFQLLVVLLLAAVGLLLVFGSVTGGEASNFSPLFTTFGGLMAAVLTWVSATHSAGLGFLYLFTFSLGMCALLVVVGLSSGAVARLPRAGMWMVWIKRLFATLMLGAAQYYFVQAGTVWI